MGAPALLSSKSGALVGGDLLAAFGRRLGRRFGAAAVRGLGAGIGGVGVESR